MFQEQIGKAIADHIRVHIGDLLTEVNSYFPDADTTTLVLPKTIEEASVVGGIYTSFDEILPQYGIDISDKILSGPGDSLWEYQYTGQINGMIHAGSRESADRLIKRHGAACELFIMRHQFFHSLNTSQFRLTEIGYASTSYSGAEDLGEPEDRPLWIAAFSLDIVIFTSEDGPGQHG